MRAQPFNRTSRALPAAAELRCVGTAVWVAGLLLAASAAGGFARGQASQTSSQSKPQQTSKASVQPSSSGPMVIGQDPDSTPDTVNVPAAPANSPAQPTATPAQPAAAKPVAPVPWNPANPPGESPAQPVTAAAAPSEPVPVPANAGGDSARQQINDECASLFKMANDLKAAVDKTDKDMLSVAVVRKADQIETLAHHVKDEMRPEVGKN